MTAQVLLIHHDRVLLDALGAALRTMGYAPLAADSLTVARRFWRRQTVDLVIIDDRSPTGAELQWVASVIKQAGTTPILVMTAKPPTDRPDLSPQCIYLRKPVSLATLLDVVEQQLSPHLLTLPKKSISTS